MTKPLPSASVIVTFNSTALASAGTPFMPATFTAMMLPAPALAGFWSTMPVPLRVSSTRTGLPAPSGETNSIALVVKHLAGNARSRWTDFLTSDGEKADRQRDREFELAEGDSRAALMAAWDAGWAALERALEPLTEDDLLRTITIRGEPHSVLKAIDRQLTHYGYHVGQIVLLARLAQGAGWKSLSVARGQSEAFNRRMRGTS